MVVLKVWSPDLQHQNQHQPELVRNASSSDLQHPKLWAGVDRNLWFNKLSR